MRSRFSAEKPDEIEFSMTITMSVKEWCDLRDQLETQPAVHPTYALKAQITDLLAQARRIYWPKENEAERERCR